MATIISMHATENVDTMGSKQMIRTFAWRIDDSHVRIINYVDDIRVGDTIQKIVIQ